MQNKLKELAEQLHAYKKSYVTVGIDVARGSCRENDGIRYSLWNNYQHEYFDTIEELEKRVNQITRKDNAILFRKFEPLSKRATGGV